MAWECKKCSSTEILKEVEIRKVLEPSLDKFVNKINNEKEIEKFYYKKETYICRNCLNNGTEMFEVAEWEE